MYRVPDTWNCFSCIKPMGIEVKNNIFFLDAFIFSSDEQVGEWQQCDSGWVNRGLFLRVCK